MSNCGLTSTPSGVLNRLHLPTQQASGVGSPLLRCCLILTTLTGGEPLFTHRVHGEYMVGSETKYPAWTHQVHFDYILITFTIYPRFAHPNTHQAHVEYFQKVPSTEPVKGGVGLPTGFILINFTIHPGFTHPNTHWVHFGYFYKVPTQIPTNYQAGYIQKVPTKNPVGKFWLNYKWNPWFLSQFTQKSTWQKLCERTPWFLSKMTL